VNRGQHAAADGSFNRSASTALARGVALIVAAVVVGVLLLRSTDGSEPFRAPDTTVAQPGPSANGTTTTTVKGATTTTAALAKAHEPAQVMVLVANGTSVKGAANKIATTLKGSNYLTAQPANTTAPASTSVVYFVAGYEADAKAIAALLKPTPGVAAMPNPMPVADIANAHVLVVLAADLAN
jgi:hypothetical protein